MRSKNTKESKKAIHKKVEIKTRIGWEEWCTLNNLGLPAIKAKIDTGAKTSSLHAFNIKTFKKEGKKYVDFQIHPIQKNRKIVRNCQSLVIDHRYVSDSGGKKEKRYVILSNLIIGNISIDIEITLTNRDNMAFRMLLGREAIKKGRMIVDVSKSFLQGKFKKNEVLNFYQ